jgi:hypothetical protein
VAVGDNEVDEEMSGFFVVGVVDILVTGVSSILFVIIVVVVTVVVTAVLKAVSAA